MKGYRKYSIHMIKILYINVRYYFLWTSHLKSSLCIEYIMWSAQSQEKDILGIKNWNKVHNIKMVISIIICVLDRLCQFFLQLCCTYKKHSTPSYRRVAKVFKEVVYEKTTTFVNNIIIKRVELIEKEHYRFQLKTKF